MSSSCSMENGRNIINIPNIRNMLLMEWHRTAEVDFEAEAIVWNVRKTRTPDRPMYTEHSHIHTPRLTHLKPPLRTWTRCPFRFYPPKPILWRSGTNSQRHREIRSHSPYSWIIFFHVLGRISSFVSESIYHDFGVEELRVTIFIPSKMDSHSISHDIKVHVSLYFRFIVIMVPLCFFFLEKKVIEQSTIF